MAEERPLASEIDGGMQRQLVALERQIQAWHRKREDLLARAQRRFENVGVDITHTWQGRDEPLREVRTQKDLDGIKDDFARAVEMTKEDHEWRDTEQTPEYQAWERERNQPIHEPDADELGWQAEQRFYAEQDPASEWYREDLYHGQMGPDVLADYHRTAEEERLGAVEELYQQQRAEARRDLAEEFAYDERQERAQFGEETGRSLPYDAILVDTSTPEREVDVQTLLARLDQRLEALTQETEALTHQHHKRMSY